MKVKRVRTSGSGRPARAHRTIVHYTATCRGCDFLPKNPREATIHATAEGHAITESKSYIVEPPEAE